MSYKQINIRYFAKIREMIGTSEEQYQTQANNVADLRVELAIKSDAYTAALGVDQVLRTAVNQYMVSEETEIHDGDEVAFFPPVTGG